MKIAIIGAGAIGCVIAGYLTKAGESVILVGREDQVSAINLKGLLLSGESSQETVRVRAATELDSKYDLVIFAVKTQDLERAYQQNARFLEDGIVLSTQNGVQADNLLSGHYDKKNIISSIVMFGATYIRPGEITLNFDGDWILGKPFVPNDPKLFQIAEVLKKAFKVSVVDDIVGMKWLKLFVNFNNCIPALTGRSMQETFLDLDLCRLSIMLLKEGLEIVNRAKVQLESLPNFPKERILNLVAMPIDQSAEIIHKTLTSLSREPLYGSILQSIMRGKDSEIDFINGEVVQLASHMRVPSPLNSLVVDLVHQVERSGQFFKIDEIKQKFSINIKENQNA